VEVQDGDTIRIGARVIRLVGFDTPEPEHLARCEAERTLAARATSRLRQIVASGSGSLDLAIVRCSCRPGTEEPKPATAGERAVC
jgi:endonuclease YncB( thermonuclease family)